MKIFREVELQIVHGAHINALNQEIQSEYKNKLLNMNETEYIAYLVEKYQIEPLLFFWDKKYIAEYQNKLVGG